MIRGAEIEVETVLGDYKEVDGWYIPTQWKWAPRAVNLNRDSLRKK